MSPTARTGAAGAELGMRRLVWRCRRGMKELDILLERYVRTKGIASAAEQRAFERFLQLPDPALAGYLLGHDKPEDPEFARLIHRITCCAAATADDPAD
jgi:antitoxin CptB